MSILYTITDLTYANFLYVPCDLQLSIRSNKDLTWRGSPENELIVFSPIVQELEKRAIGEGSGSLSHHHIGAQVVNTRSRFFETTQMIYIPMESQLNEWLLRSPTSDKLERRCVRALANLYDTSLNRSSKDCKPIMEVHRDNVNNADLTIMLGITPTSQYWGAML